MKSQAHVITTMRYLLIPTLIFGLLLAIPVGDAHAQATSELPVLDNLQGEVLIDVY